MMRGERRMKNKAPVPVHCPLFWLFRPPFSHKNRLTAMSKGPTKRRSITRKLSHFWLHLQQHKLQEIITLRGHESPLIVRLSAKKIIFAQSKFRMFKHSVEKEKRENLLFKQILASRSQLVS